MTSIALNSPPETRSTTNQEQLKTTLRVLPPANDPVTVGPEQEVLRRVTRAIRERQVCVILYSSEPGGAPTTRAIEPIAVITTRGSFGILAWCRLRCDLRTFRTDRIRGILRTVERFEDHPGLALERFIQHRRRDLP